MMFSEEVYNALKFGYKIEVLRGYQFERAKIFKEYVHDMFAIKASSHKSDAMYLISKLLLNSLYGRFSLDFNLGKTLLVDHTQFEQLLNDLSLEIIDHHDFRDGFYLVKFRRE